MPTVEGIIEKIEQKSGSNTKGPWASYIIRVRNHPKPISTFDTTIGKGLEAGKAYSFQVEQKGDFLNLVKGTTPEEVAFPMPGPDEPPASNGYQDTKDLSIRRQVALKAAVELVLADKVPFAMLLAQADHMDAWLNWALAGDGAPEPSKPAQRAPRGSSGDSEGEAQMRAAIKEKVEAQGWLASSVGPWCAQFGGADDIDGIPAGELERALAWFKGK